MTSKIIFGTDGIRGQANVEPMTAETVLKLGKSLIHYLQLNNDNKYQKVLIGKDTRLSGYMFEQSISAGIISMGTEVMLVGPIPTPAISFLTTDMRADAGVVISASHNPYYDNGIKFFDSSGIKFEESEENEIENILINRSYLNNPSSELGKAYRIDDASGRYVCYLKNTFNKKYNLNGLKIVLDCSNGAGYKVSPLVLEELGAQVIALSIKPDGKNINLDCGALYPDNVSKTVIQDNADLGIALDGDADRVIFIDHKGNVIDGDKILAICINNIVKEYGNNNTFVITEMSNLSLQRFIESLGSRFIVTQVGDKHVVNEMIKSKSKFGGEKSGHLIFLDYSYTGDGTLAALQVLSIMINSGKSLYDLSKIIDLYPQILVNVKVHEKIPFKDIPELDKYIKSSQNLLGKNGRINLRYSGTEKLARIMVEGQDHNIINNVVNELSSIINQHIGHRFNA